MPKAMNDNRRSHTGEGAEAAGKACPICGKASTSDFKPFCSKRCADVDLHRWLGGTYAIPLAEGEAEVPDPTDDE